MRGSARPAELSNIYENWTVEMVPFKNFELNATAIKLSLHPYVKKSYGNKIKMYRSLVRHAINIQNSYNAVLTSIVPIIPCLKFAFYRSLIQHFQF